jgi:hypothetical protein
MKKFLAPIAAIFAVAGFSSAAFAQTETIEQAGSVTGNCTIEVTDGALQTNAGFVNSIESATKGKITTKCNTKASSLTVKLDSSASETLSNGQIITRGYKLDGGTGAYLSRPNQTVFGTADTTKSDISNNFSAIASTLDVSTQVKAPSGQLLSGGSYTVKVKATVSP